MQLLRHWGQGVASKGRRLLPAPGLPGKAYIGNTGNKVLLPYPQGNIPAHPQEPYPTTQVLSAAAL